MKRVVLLFFISALGVFNSLAQEKASTILEKAFNQAKIENKNVFVIFHASWCSWCVKMDKKMNDETCKELFEKNYVIAHLVIWESDKNKHLENPGAMDLFNKHKGENTGIPFWLVYSKNKELLANSLDSNGKNVGCPEKINEVEVFVKALRQTSNLTDEEIKIIEKKFLETNKTQG